MAAENYHGRRLPLIPAGGRTALRSGGPLPGDAVAVSTADLNRIVDYPARDMTITIEAGLRVEELRDQLGTQHQRLPIDIPQAHRATIGGAMACNASGPGRQGYGTFRDYLLGVTAVDGQGRLFSAGGRVVKNVAGYDLCKLLIGSQGTLATITQVTLKVRPLAEVRSLVCVATSSLDRADGWFAALNCCPTRPVLLELLNPKAVAQLQPEMRLELPADRWLVCIGYEGGQRETDWQVEQTPGILQPAPEDVLTVVSGEAADRVWQALTEYQAASDDPLTFQASLPPSQLKSFIALAQSRNIAIQAHAGVGIVIGHLPDKPADPQRGAGVVAELRAVAQQLGGSLTVLSCDEDWKSNVDLFGPPPDGLRIMQGLKQALDPANLYSPGRLWPQLGNGI